MGLTQLNKMMLNHKVQRDKVEIFLCEEVLFCGSYEELGNSFWAYNEDGSLENFGLSYTGGDGIERDADGNPIDTYEPSVTKIIKLVIKPELVCKGDWGMFFIAFLICGINVHTILFADELFRWALAFRIRNVESAQASDWEIATRYISRVAFIVWR